MVTKQKLRRRCKVVGGTNTSTIYSANPDARECIGQDDNTYLLTGYIRKPYKIGIITLRTKRKKRASKPSEGE